MLLTLLYFTWFFVTGHCTNLQADEVKAKLKALPEAERDAIIESLYSGPIPSTSIPTNVTPPSGREMEEVTEVTKPKIEGENENITLFVMAEKDKSRRNDDISDGGDRSDVNSSADNVNVSDNDNKEKKTNKKNGENDGEDDNDQNDDGIEQNNDGSDGDVNSKRRFKDDNHENKSNEEDNLSDEKNTKKTSNKSSETDRSRRKSNKFERKTGHKYTHNTTQVNANNSHEVEKKTVSKPQNNRQHDESEMYKTKSYTPETDEDGTTISTLAQATATSTSTSYTEINDLIGSAEKMGTSGHDISQLQEHSSPDLKSLPEPIRDALIESMTLALKPSISSPTNITTPRSRRMEEVTDVGKAKLDGEDENKTLPIYADKDKSRRDISDGEDRSDVNTDNNMSDNDNKKRKLYNKNEENDGEGDINDQVDDGFEQDNKDSDSAGNAKRRFNDDDGDDDKKTQK